MNGQLTKEIKEAAIRWCARGHFPKSSDAAFYFTSTYRDNLRTRHVSDKQRLVNIRSKVASLVAGDQLLDETAGLSRAVANDSSETTT